MHVESPSHAATAAVAAVSNWDLLQSNLLLQARKVPAAAVQTCRCKNMSKCAPSTDKDVASSHSLMLIAQQCSG